MVSTFDHVGAFPALFAIAGAERDEAANVSDSLPDYLRAGCRRAAVRSDAADADTADLIVVPATAGGERLFADAVGKTTGRSVLVVTGIKDSRAARRFWRAVAADRRVGVTFDLYYAGVAFFDTKRYKHNYIVNF